MHRVWRGRGRGPGPYFTQFPPSNWSAGGKATSPTFQEPSAPESPHRLCQPLRPLPPAPSALQVATGRHRLGPPSLAADSGPGLPHPVADGWRWKLGRVAWPGGEAEQPAPRGGAEALGALEGMAEASTSDDQQEQDWKLQLAQKVRPGPPRTIVRSGLRDGMLFFCRTLLGCNRTCAL